MNGQEPSIFIRNLRDGRFAMICNLTISRRFFLVSLMGVVTPAFISIQSLINTRQALIEANSSEVRHLVETAWATAYFYNDLANKGIITQTSAQQEAKNVIRAMHYDGKNYFFI